MLPSTSPGGYRPSLLDDPMGQQLLIEKQKQIIELYKETSRDRDEIINHLKRLVNLQETQIEDLKLKLSELRKKQ